MNIEQSPGEVFDRLAIREIKLERISDPSLHHKVVIEYDKLVAAVAACDGIVGVEDLRVELKRGTVGR